MKDLIKPGKYFMMGNHACVEASILAGCRFFAGYPITPSSEIFERACERFPQVGGFAVEMEDEIASIAALIGASYAGAKAMTATSGPGFSLMVENIGMAFIMEAPCVIINVQRAGPSTGIPTLVGQGDMMQSKWGTHGDIEIVAYCPNSVQEFFDLTIKAFNTSEKYRIPVVVLADQVIGLMYEKLLVPPYEEIEIINREILDPKKIKKNLPFDYSKNILPMPIVGTGCRLNIDSLTHDEKGYPTTDQEISERMLRYLLGKIRKNEEKIWEYEEYLMDDAEVAICCYGSTSRSSIKAIKELRKLGIKAGLFRFITPWPFPYKPIEKLSRKVNVIVVPEINFGQMIHPIKEHSKCEVKGINWAPGSLIEPKVIVNSTINIFNSLKK